MSTVTHVSSSRARAVLLPGRPPAGAAWAGPEPAPDDATRPRTRVRALSCSGGGIRAAAFTLGARQRLSCEPDGNRSVHDSVDFVTSVSGGGYVAGSYAIVQHHLPSGATPAAYTPGTPEDNQLRAHTRYLVDSKTQLAISVLGIVWGLAMNLGAILAAAFVVSTGLGRLIGIHALRVLTLTADGRWSVHFPAWLPHAVGMAAAVGVVVYALYRFVDIYHPLGEVATKRWVVTSLIVMAVAALAATLLIGVPWALVGLSRAGALTSRVGTQVQTGTFFGTLTAVVLIVQKVLRTYAPAKDDQGGTALSTAITKATDPLRKRVSNVLLPWTGSALVVVLLVVAMLTWVSNAARASHDRTELGWVVGCVAVVVVWKAVTDGNRTSLHSYYTQRLARAFARTRDGAELEPPAQYLSGFATEHDGPPLVICAAVNTDQPGGTPSGRNCAPFTFSPHRSGISSGTMFRGRPDVTGFDLAGREAGGPDRMAWEACRGASEPHRSLSMDTSSLESFPGSHSVMDLVAVSGAAVSPAMGRMSRPSVRLLLGVANVRLGMWLPNPMRPHSGGSHKVSRLIRQLRQPGLIYLMREVVGGLSLHGRWVYVTDGGHYENLGLVEALRRGATEVFVFDASGDKPFTLATFGEAVETARADLGVEIALEDPGALGESDVKGLSRGLAARATATYANGVRATIYLCKAGLIADLPPDVTAWAHQHPSFPNDSTLNQFYGDREFEAYRSLGWEAARAACRLWRADRSPAVMDEGTDRPVVDPLDSPVS